MNTLLETRNSELETIFQFIVNIMSYYTHESGVRKYGRMAAEDISNIV